MFRYYPLGDSALIIKVNDKISIETHKTINALEIEIENSKIVGIIELIPTYNELTLIYDPNKMSYNQLLDKLKEIEGNIKICELPIPKLIHIPVCYADDLALDMDIVAKTNKLHATEVVNIHSGTVYFVYMLGFTPGFCYLGGMDEKIVTPRKKNPRILIEAGSVGIAGNQTGIYPIDSPGGWQIIGKTPLKLFDPNREKPFLVEAGNYIKFDPICKAEFEKIELLVNQDIYKLRITEKSA